jgi:hypothetical protein
MVFVVVYTHIVRCEFPDILLVSIVAPVLTGYPYT